MKLNIILDDVRKAVEECNPIHSTCNCVLAQAAKRVIGKVVDYCGFTCVGFKDSEFQVNEVDYIRISRVVNYFDSHFKYQSPEQIFDYYEAQGLLEFYGELNHADN